MRSEVYYMYLRKSRADAEAEAHGEGETLSRHEKALMELARKQKLNVTKIFREIVSGETIAARPEIQKLLAEVEQGLCAGVLVMEVERLARGNTKDQGIVSEAFQYGNVKIITPLKTYDPANEFDEEYFEFGLFMSRREFRTINRRLQRGRLASVKEGKYIAGTPPYGYRKVKIPNDKGYTLEIIPERADIVRLIFELYTVGEIQPDGSKRRLGFYLIAEHLDSMGIKPLISSQWSSSTIKDILSNVTYIGKVPWQRELYSKKVINGRVREKRTRNDNMLVVDALHPAIISEDTFCKAQEIMSKNYVTPVTSNQVLKNPLSGLVRCAKCGALMTRTNSNTKAGYYVLSCPTRKCDNISSPIYLIENKIIHALEDWLASYKLQWSNEQEQVIPYSIQCKKTALGQLQSDIDSINQQLDKTFDLLEQGIYDNETFLSRKQKLVSRLDDLRNSQTTLQEEYDNYLKFHQLQKDVIPTVETIISLYHTLETASQKNELLKKVIEYVTYEKNTRTKKGQLETSDFELHLFPKIPK